MQSRTVYTAIMCLNNKFERNYVRILCIVIRNQNQVVLEREEIRNGETKKSTTLFKLGFKRSLNNRGMVINTAEEEF